MRTGEMRSTRAESVVLALPFEQTQRLLPRTAGAGRGGESALAEKLERFVHAPITTVHLWFDREITESGPCGLLDTGIQWMFNKSRIRGYARNGQLCGAGDQRVGRSCRRSARRFWGRRCEELELFFPEVREAKLLKSGVLKEARATFSVAPGLDRYRPAQRTEWPGLYLAGDWTRTGWPSTMEGAVRSGRLAAGAVVGDRSGLWRGSWRRVG